ncbi:hypothetical protein OEV82_08410 [Caldibacillus thermolactis]|jgi:hypothetical protein|uniref:Uncharacterized protein n=1 Tax=Pallidibacillus thermolactis TaxID=251051 RepID=A0ABT2WFP1_9BACI|nr:hypothetical protein [Pallidibacillus thermolactis]MCU9594478.1 hypothetical protein [Pallidibacillus thermolactis]MCU9602592.1 hypothetical protein [Pallidibacillus thermolactis subsp. kokeshiiformis]MED1675050.1 hypothetical protein [Pallidibacillus thermolactis subsp. kokeshiiformis]
MKNKNIRSSTLKREKKAALGKYHKGVKSLKIAKMDKPVLKETKKRIAHY